MLVQITCNLINISIVIPLLDTLYKLLHKILGHFRTTFIIINETAVKILAIEITHVKVFVVCLIHGGLADQTDIIHIFFEEKKLN